MEIPKIVFARQVKVGLLGKGNDIETFEELPDDIYNPRKVNLKTFTVGL